MTPLAAVVDALLILGMGYYAWPLWTWSLLGFAILLELFVPASLLAIYAVVALILNVAPLRRMLVSRPLLALVRRLGAMPRISTTEREALLAGDSWIERDLFSGRPDLRKLMAEPYPTLSEREREFLAGPTTRACASLSDWDAWRRHDLPPETWELLKRERFFGMIIPEAYGGLALSPFAHGEVIHRLASRSAALAITAMVPNSLGPAKLLLEYGTQAQRDHYLPRLARGEEIPCFALTEPEAGSDASSIRSEGVLFRGAGGRFRIRLNWDKRYTTLAPVATVIGLAFRLRDPEGLLGKGADVGITCALVATNALGVTIDRRHDPMGVPFLNSPNHGRDVEISADAIIGGLAQAGHGWAMLMQCLADGRGISLPAESAGTAKLVTRVASAYAATRMQFDLPIGRFEGVAERLARMGAATYAIDSLRCFLGGALGAGLRPPVATAIAKVELTELGRQVINDGMDVLGGAGLVRGPRNLIANAYIGAPIGITVEGANIMTRALIIFGQGAIRAHPFALREIEAVERRDVSAFDAAWCGHVRHAVGCVFRAVLLGLTTGWFAEPGMRHPLRRYRRRLSWASASFATWSELTMLSQGGALKRHEALTGRLADALSWQLVAASILRRFEADGRPREDLPFAHAALDLSFRKIGLALDGVRANLRIPGLTWLVRLLSTRLTWIGSAPWNSDALARELARLIQLPGAQRERVFGGVYLPTEEGEPLARLERALRATAEAEPARGKIRQAVRRGILHRAVPETIAAEACAAGVITELELAAIRQAQSFRELITEVDDFPIAGQPQQQRKQPPSRGAAARGAAA